MKVQDSTDILFWLCDEKTHEGNEWANYEFSVGFVEMLPHSNTPILGKIIIIIIMIISYSPFKSLLFFYV